MLAHCAVRSGRAAERLRARPAVRDRDRPPYLRGHRGIMGHHQHRHAQLSVGPLQRAEYVHGGRAVELTGRLVGQQQFRPVRQRGRDRRPLLLPARHLVRPAIGARRHSEHRQQLRGPGRALPPAGSPQPHRQDHVLPGRQVRQQVARRLLPDEAHDIAPVAEPLARGHAGQVVTGDPHRAGGRRVQPGQDVHQRRLPAARRAHDRGQLALVDQQVKALQGLHLDALERVDPHQPVTDHQSAGAVRGAGQLGLGRELADA